MCFGVIYSGTTATRNLERRQEVKMRHKKGQMRGKELNTNFSLFVVWIKDLLRVYSPEWPS